MKKFEIIQEFFTRNDCYKANIKIVPRGIMVHSVGCKGTEFKRWRSWNKSYKLKETNRQVCCHAFIDYKSIHQILPWDHRGWHCAGRANNTHISFEICEPLTREETPEIVAEIWERVVYLCTYLCKLYNIKPINIICHQEGARLGIANNHADVFHWWGKNNWQGYTMKRLRDEVAKELGTIINTEKTPTPAEIKKPITLRRGMKSEEVKNLQKALQQQGYNIGKMGADGIFGRQTEKAVKDFQKNNNLIVDGLAGKKTQEALYRGKNGI